MKRSILMLEHDDDDRYITQAVFDEHNYPVKLHFVDSSNDLFAFLISCEKTYTPYPSLILLNHYTKPTSAFFSALDNDDLSMAFNSSSRLVRTFALASA